MSASDSASGWNNGRLGISQAGDPQQLSYGSQISFPDQSALCLHDVGGNAVYIATARSISGTVDSTLR